MVKLDKELCPVLMYGVREPLYAGDILILRHRKLVDFADSVFVVDSCDLGENKPSAAFGPCLVIGNHFISDKASGIGTPAAHRRHNEAVRNFDIAYFTWGRQIFEHMLLLLFFTF